MHAWMKMLRRTRYTKRKKHTLQPKYKVARMKSYFVLTLNPAQCKRTTVTNTIYFRLWEKLNLKNSVSVSAHVRNSSFPSHQESCPPSNSSSTLPPVWSFWNTNVSRLLPCLHHFDIHPFLQCFQIEFKLPDIKDSHDLIPDFFTSFIFNYSSSPLPSKLLFSILQTLKNTCCYKRPFHGVVLRICIHFSLYLVKCPLFLFFLMNFHLSFKTQLKNHIPHIYIYICVCMCIFIDICVCMYVCTYVCVYVYMYIHTYIHKYIYINTHTYVTMYKVNN